MSTYGERAPKIGLTFSLLPPQRMAGQSMKRKKGSTSTHLDCIPDTFAEITPFIVFLLHTGMPTLVRHRLNAVKHSPIYKHDLGRDSDMKFYVFL